MSIGRFSLNNAVVINILLVAFLILGGLSALRLPREQFADVPFFLASVLVAYPGASAEDVERGITIPLEDELDELPDLKQITSVSREGVSLIRVEFDEGITDRDFERLYQQAQTAVAAVELPEGALAPKIDDFSSADFEPVIEVVLSGDLPFPALNETSRLVEERLKAIRGVGDVRVIGARDFEITISADPQQLEARGLSIDEIVTAIRSSNVTVPAGTLQTPTRNFLLRTMSEADTPQQLGQIIVRLNPGRGGFIRLSDVAGIEEAYDPDGGISRYNENRSIAFSVSKIVGESSFDVVKRVRATTAALEATLPEGAEITLTRDSTVQIGASLRVLITNSIIGFGLLLLFLFLFMGLRNAIITALGIPTTFALTFLILDLMGETLNGNTLFGLVLVLGLIVDHGIVIVENSFRLRQSGLTRTEAAIKGTNEVAGPVIAATLTTVAAFLPLMILPGTIGRFLRVIPLTVSIALLASTAEALLFLPVHVAEWSAATVRQTRQLFDRFRRWYENALSVVYRRRYLALGVAFAVLIVTFALAGTLQQDLFSAEDFSYFTIDLELPPGSSVAKTSQVVGDYERRIMSLVGKGEIVAIASDIGYGGNDTGSVGGSNVARMTVDILERDERKTTFGQSRSISAIMQDVERLVADVPGADSVRYKKAENGPPQDPPISFRLFGDDYADLAVVSAAIKQELARYPEVYSVVDNLEEGSPELRVRINQERAAEFGLSASQIGQFMRASYDGIGAGTIFRDNQETDIVVRYADGAAVTAAGRGVAELLQLKIPTQDGRQIPFSSVAAIERGASLGAIRRLDGKREVTIAAETTDGSIVRGVNGSVASLFRSEFQPFYPGVTLRVGGEFAEFATLLGRILRIFLVGVFLIYVTLGAQFKSYLQPVLILFAVPFAFVGVIQYLLVSGTPFSTTVLYAAVALAGVAVNDSIVLVSRINELRKQGVAAREAVLGAASTRLRPILLTSLTTIAGTTPTALGLGGKSVIWGPMASTIIFGLIFSTLTALIVVPCLYGILEDIRGRNKRKVPDAHNVEQNQSSDSTPGMVSV